MVVGVGALIDTVPCAARPGQTWIELGLLAWYVVVTTIIRVSRLQVFEAMTTR